LATVGQAKRDAGSRKNLPKLTFDVHHGSHQLHVLPAIPPWTRQIALCAAVLEFNDSCVQRALTMRPLLTVEGLLLMVGLSAAPARGSDSSSPAAAATTTVSVFLPGYRASAWTPLRGSIIGSVCRTFLLYLSLSRSLRVCVRVSQAPKSQFLLFFFSSFAFLPLFSLFTYV